MPMDLRNAAHAYRQSALENAPPVKIVRLLYEGAIRFLGRAVGRAPGDADRGRWLGRADAIVKELRLALEPGHDPSLAENLEQLYLFVENRIARGRIEGDDHSIEEARSILETLLEGWRHVESDGLSIGGAG